LKKKSGQNFYFNPVKCAPKVKRANIMARANNTAPMVHSCRDQTYQPPSNHYNLIV